MHGEEIWVDILLTKTPILDSHAEYLNKKALSWKITPVQSYVSISANIILVSISVHSKPKSVTLKLVWNVTFGTVT